MAVGDDDMREDSVSPLILNGWNSNQSADALSADDVAWVDSCLIKDSDISDSDWTSMKDALLNILGSEADSLNTTSTTADDISTTDIEIIPSNVEAETAQSPLITDNDLVSIYEEVENKEDDNSKEHKNFSSESQNSFENAFLPGCTDGMLENENIDSGLDLGISAFYVEASTDDIFKVWDLDIPAGEDELVEQLKKALAESSFKLTPSTSVDSKMSEELKEDILDELIAGITDLSLTQKSG